MKALKLARKYRSLLKMNGINSPLRLVHFFAQLHHESNLQPVSENMNYSENALLRVFKKYFPSRYSASRFASKPREIANKVYANRMGNGDESSGDGWKYRGRGFIQLTGKEMYKKLSNAVGVDYVNYPDKLLNEADAMVAACWYWKNHGLNQLADLDDVKKVTRRINGGYNGLRHREQLTILYKDVFL